MLDTQRKIKIIMILLPILVVGSLLGLYIKNEIQAAEKSRVSSENAERERQEFVKALELRDAAKAEEIARKKSMDSLSEITKSTSKTAIEFDRAMLENIDTTTAEGKQKWAEYKKRINPSE